MKTMLLPRNSSGLNSAAFGGVAGHFAHHHAIAGEPVGCAIGHHWAHK